MMLARTDAVPVGEVENDICEQILEVESTGFSHRQSVREESRTISICFHPNNGKDGLKTRKTTGRRSLGKKMGFRCLLVLDRICQTSKGSYPEGN